jgi:calcium-dependent protein kinase
MGSKSSKKQKNDELKKIGEEANKTSPSTFSTYTQVNLTNELLVGKSKSDPEEDYKKLNFLGEGSFASVYKVQNKFTDVICAMKVINKTFSCTIEDENEILNEINILRTMDHPGILKIFEFYSSKQNYSIVTELCPGGELFQQIIDKGPFTEKYSAYVMYQIFSAVNYCHKMHIVHRDLKPENILIVGKDREGLPTIKICDFGTSKMFEKGAVQRKLVGSSYYIAPEVLKKHYNEKCDVWSCGVIMYILLSARPPFGGEDDNEIMERVATGKYDLESPPFNKLSKNSLDLIKRLLTMDPDQRISAEQALNHPWFKEFKSQEIYNRINDNDTMKTLVENLKKYKRTSIIQETALAYLVHHFPQIKDVVNSCKLFNQIDKSGDGKITKAELLRGLSERYKSDTLEADVEEIYKNLDMDNNGYIGYEEFVRAAVSKEYFVKDNVLRFAFRYFDKDGSGEITFDEIEALFSQSISDKTKVHETLVNIIKEVDKNN